MDDVFEELLADELHPLTITIRSEGADMVELKGSHLIVAGMRWSTSCRVMFLNSVPKEVGGKLMGQWVQAAIKQHEGNGAVLEAKDEKIEADFPAIFDFLTCNIGEGGKPRAVGSLTLFARSGSWHACLKDRQTKRTWWGEGDTFQAALSALDTSIRVPY